MAKLLLIAAALSAKVVAHETQREEISIECFKHLIGTAQKAIPIGIAAAKLAGTCNDGVVMECVDGVIGLVDGLAVLESSITGAVGACDKNAKPECIKAVQGVGDNIHKITGTLKDVKTQCLLSPTTCIANVKNIIPAITNIPESIQHAARGCAGHTSYDWCDCGKGHNWIDVWDESNPSDRHRVKTGGWAPIQWTKPVSQIGWVCDGMSDKQRANLPANQAWRVSFTVENKQCGFWHQSSGRIEWDSAVTETDGTNETSIVV